MELPASTRCADPAAAVAQLLTRVIQAVKAVAIARRVIRQNGSELVMLPSFPVAGKSTSAVIELSTRSEMVESADDETESLVAKPTSESSKVAGAIAGRTRQGEEVQLVARGKESVLVAVESLARALSYLKNEQSLLVAPRFIESEVPGEQDPVTFLCFDMIPHPL